MNLPLVRLNATSRSEKEKVVAYPGTLHVYGGRSVVEYSDAFGAIKTTPYSFASKDCKYPPMQLVWEPEKQ